MSDNITGFYRSVLALPRVDSSLQRQVFRHGTRRADHALLALLASRNDLDLTLDKELGKVDAAVVKVAWASRPERTESDLIELVRTEKRVKVLAALAERDDLPAALFTAIATHAKSTALEALLLNMNVELETKIVAARRYATQVQGKRLSRSVTSLLAQDQQIAEEIARHTSNFRLGAAALSAAGSAGSAESYDNVVHLAIAAMADSELNSDWETYSALEHLGTELMQDPDHDRDLAKSYLKALKSVAQTHNGTWVGSRYRNIVDTLSKVTPRKKTAGLDLVAAARNASTPEEAQALIGLFMAAKADVTGPALVAAARNEAVSAENLIEILQHSSFGWYVSRDLMWAYPRLSVEKAAAVHITMAWMNDDSLLSRHPEPTSVLVHTARMAARRDVLPAVLLNSRYLSDEVIDELPFTVFNASDGLPIAVTERIATRMHSRLGEDDTAWETLNALAPAFNGSVSELIEVVTRV